MNKKTAIVVIQKQIDDLDNNAVDRDVWRFKTGTLVKEIFGENSLEYVFISQFSWSLGYNPFSDPEQNKYASIQVENGIRQFLKDCIDTIKLKGIHQPKGANFMSLWSFKSVIVVLFSIFFVGLCLGAIIGADRLGMIIPFLNFFVRLFK